MPPRNIVNILEYCDGLKVDRPVYLYAGSFYARYLRMADELNKLVRNEKEEPLHNCAEFNPLLTADKRINKITIWQKPVSAEYLLLGMEEEIKKPIAADAVIDIKKGTQSKTVVFKPYAYNILLEKLGRKNVIYFADILV
ncbi:MAG: hypothetical protein PVH64_08380 [Bacillota bacterium]